ncbi:Uncharacterised protein [Mycobacteroides abscessus subsp. abscessus]|nr:Uncharacterised protein [Mycobacteroides abscessus subsp. abscessus]
MTPHRLIPSAQFQSSMPICPTGLPPIPTPALLITRVGGPEKTSCASKTSFSTSSREETSQVTARAQPEDNRSIWATVSAARSPSMSAQIT